MTAPIPKLLADGLLDEMNEYILGAEHYFPEDHPCLLAWDREINRFLTTHPGHAQICLSRIAHFQGDVDNAEHYLDRALDRGVSQPAVWDNALMIYSNLVFATKAQEVARKLIGVDRGNIRVAIATVLACGGVRLVGRLLEQARKAELDMNTVTQIATIKEIAGAFEQAPDVDEQFAAAIDCAGEVLRKRKLFWLERAPRFRFDSGTGCFGIRYRVAVTPAEASQMTVDTADLLIARNLQAVPITIGFTGVKA